MTRMVKCVGTGILLAVLSIAAATAQQLDPKVVTFKLNLDAVQGTAGAIAAGGALDLPRRRP